MKTFIRGLPEAEINKRINERLVEINNDTEFVNHLISLGFDDALITENISFIVDYFEDFKKCRECKDVNKCLLGEHFVKKVTFKDNNLNFEYDVCSKFKKINRVKNLSFICDIQDEVLTKNIATDLDRTDVRKKVFSSLYELYSKKKPSFMFIYGRKSSGVSFMTSLFYKEIIAKNQMTGAYLLTPKRFSELADQMFNNKPEFAKSLNELQNVEVLVLNKLSNYNFTEFFRNNVFFPILEHRISNGLSTIITSELKYEDFLTLLNVKNSNRDIRYIQIKDLLDDFEKHNMSINVKIYN